MRITRIFIDGYGNRRRWESGPLSEGLNLIAGPNEAGKSTIFSFVRTLLYGFSPKNSGHPYFPLGADADFGGRMELVWQGLPYTLERYLRGRRDPAVLRNRNGNSVDCGECPGSKILGVSSEVFSNIFSISLSELRQFDSKQQSEIMPYFLGITERISERVNPREVLDNLAKDADALSKIPGGRRRLPRRLEVLKEEGKQARDRLRQQQEWNERARISANEIEQIDAKLDELRQRETQLLHDQKRTIHRRQVWETARRMAELERELESNASLLVFPLDRAPEIERLDERLRALSEQIDRTERQARDCREQAANITLDERILADRERFEVLVRRMELMQQRFLELGRTISGAQDHEARLERELSRQPTSGGMEMLRQRAEAGTLLEDERRTIRHLESIQSLLAAIQREEREREAIRHRLNEAETEHRLLTERLPGDPDEVRTVADPSKWLELRQAAQAVELLESSHREIQEEIGKLESRQQELEAEETRQREEGAKQSKQQNNYLTIAVILIGLGCVVLGSKFGGWFDVQGITLIVLGAGVLVAGILGVGIGLNAARLRRSALDKLQQVTAPRRQECEQHLTELQERLQQVQGVLAIRRPDLQKLATELCQTWPVTPEQIERELERTRVLDAARSDLARLDLAAQNVRRLIQELEARDATIREYRDRLELAERDADPVRRLWGLPMDLEPAQAIETIRALVRLVQDYVALADRRRNISMVQDEIDRFRKEVVVFCREWELHPPERWEDIPDCLNQAGMRAKQQTELQNRLNELKGTLKQCESNSTELRGTQAALYEELRNLLQKASCETVDEYRQKLDPARRIRQQQERLEELRTELARSDEGSLLLARARTAVRESGEDELERLGDPFHEADLESELEHVKLELQRLAQTRGNLERQVSEFRDKIDLASAESTILSIEEERRRVARQFDVLQVAYFLLDRAIDRFRREHQPEVFQYASQYLSRMTNGRYARVVSPLDETPGAGLEVLPAEPGPSWRADQLSRGTQEQLYLALRIALAREIVKDSEPVPLFFDDLLVNFDEIRLESTYGVLEEIAQHHQVFLFTCHRRIADDVIARLNPTTIELERG